jgi:hypothetical protein
MHDELIVPSAPIWSNRDSHPTINKQPPCDAHTTSHSTACGYHIHIHTEPAIAFLAGVSYIPPKSRLRQREKLDYVQCCHIRNPESRRTQCLLALGMPPGPLPQPTRLRQLFDIFMRSTTPSSCVAFRNPKQACTSALLIPPELARRSNYYGKGPTTVQYCLWCSPQRSSFF